MYFTPTIFIAKLLATIQVLITLDMPLSTTMALPVTSKPIESTVENLAWQAWIELPPEQKQQVKSRKVTPKSIFTLPLRVECPEGHKQVDTKCIPIVIGSNDVLIDLNALGLLVGDTQTEDIYDYDVGDENTNPFPFGGEITAEESGDGLAVELKPPSRDEPLKFNIFENKFDIFHEPLEDYSAISNESTQKEQNLVVTTSTPSSSSSYSNIKATNGILTEASNLPTNFYVQQKRNFSSSDSEAEKSEVSTTLSEDIGFKSDGISLPFADLGVTKQNKLPLIRNDSVIQLVTSIMDTDPTTDDRNEYPDSDIQTLLQTESLLPLLNHTTATTLLQSVVNDSFLLKAVPLQETKESSFDNVSFNIDDEITTLPNNVEQYMGVENKREYTRSVTMNPKIYNDNDSGYTVDNDEILERATNDQPLETTTAIQLDETTVIDEKQSPLSTTSSGQEELKELLSQQERRIRKDQKYDHVVLKKSKVQPVEILFTTTEATPSVTNSANFPTETTSIHKLTTATSETAIPLFSARNEDDNNDRFLYQQFAKKDVMPHSGSGLRQETAPAATSAAEISIPVSSGIDSAETQSTTIENISLTSEADLGKEFSLINEQPITIATMQTPTITTTEKPLKTTKTTLFTDDSQQNLALNSHSESLTKGKMPTLSTLQIWSKIMPLLKTLPTTPMSKTPAELKGKYSTIYFSERSNKNSKLIRTTDFNSIATSKSKENYATIEFPETTTTTTLEEATTYTTTTTNSSQNSPTQNNTYEPYWWLPVSWRLDKPTSSEKQQQQEMKSEKQSLLLRFWSAYAPVSR